MKLTPHVARIYILAAAFLIALPTLASLYKGHTGKFLVATHEINPASPFHRSVVYIARHNLFMAYGFVINKPLSPELLEKKRIESYGLPAYYGGPVSFPDAAFMLAVGNGGWPVFLKDEKDLAKGERYLFGYAGWGPLQLNYEMARGGWVVIDYEPDFLFGIPSSEVWENARKKAFGQKHVGNAGLL